MILFREQKAEHPSTTTTPYDLLSPPYDPRPKMYGYRDTPPPPGLTTMHYT